MSQLILDDQLDVQVILPALAGWKTAVRIQQLRPGELIRDDRIPSLLLSLTNPTFLTIDRGFWKRQLCHRRYCILFFALSKEEQGAIPVLMRRLFSLPQFRTRSSRMGKVARVGKRSVVYWQAGTKQKLKLPSLDK